MVGRAARLPRFGTMIPGTGAKDAMGSITLKRGRRGRPPYNDRAMRYHDG